MSNYKIYKMRYLCVINLVKIILNWQQKQVIEINKVKVIKIR